MRRLAAFLVASLLVSASALAAVRLPIEGDWGNASGCGWLTGDGASDTDTMIMLRADWISAYIFSCDIVRVSAGREGASLVSGICHEEGTLDSLFTRDFILRPLAGGAMEIFWDDGDKWGEVEPC